MLTLLRLAIRKNFQLIVEHLDHEYLMRPSARQRIVPSKPVCLFCFSGTPITKEYVFRKWAFENKPGNNFVSKINGLTHYYGGTTIPVCAHCNNEIPSAFKKQIIQIFKQHNLPNDFFEDDQLEDIIRWLELLDYKFQVFSLATKFRAHKKTGTINFLSDYPLSVLDANLDYSPAKVIVNLRQSLKRISVRSKTKNIYSLVIFKSHNPGDHFFHKNNDYIFVELAHKKIAMFYFYKLVFEDAISARDAALVLIKEHY